MNTKRFILSVFLSWLLLLSLDFLAHASLLRSFWAMELAALKPLEDLFLLIPSGYLSFLLLTGLVGWFSFLNLSFLFLFLICLVYFIELMAVGLCFGYLMHPPKVKKRGWIIISVFFFIFAIKNIV